MPPQSLKLFKQTVWSLLQLDSQLNRSCFFSVEFVSPQRQSLDRVFLRDAVLDRLQDDIPEVVAAALRVLEVSYLNGCNACYRPVRVWLTDSVLLQVLIDDLDPEDVVSSLLTLLHRQELTVSERWSESSSNQKL